MKFFVPSSQSFVLLLAIVAALLVTGLSARESKESDKSVHTIEVESDEVYDSESEETYENNSKESPYSEPSGSESYYGPPPPPPPPPAYFNGPYGPPAYEASVYPHPEPSPGYYESPKYPAPANYSASYGPSYPTPSYPAPSYPAPSYSAPSYSAPSYEAPKYQAPENYSTSYSETPKYSAPSYASTPSYTAPTSSYPETPSYSAPAPSYPEPPKYSAPAPSYPSTPSYPEPAPSSYSAPAPSYSSSSYSAPAPSYPETPKYSAQSYTPAPSYSAPSYPETPSYSAPAPSYPEPPKYSAPAPSYPSTPSYPEPAPSSYSAPAPSYSAPAPSYPETPKYTAPTYSSTPSYSAPAPSYSAPAPSYPETPKYTAPSYASTPSYSAPAASYSAPAASYPEPPKYSAPAPSYSSAPREYTPAPAPAPASSPSYTTPAPSYAPPAASPASYSAPVAQSYPSSPAYKSSPAPTYRSSYPMVTLQYPQHLISASYPAKQAPVSNYTRYMPAYEPYDSPWGENALPPYWWVYQVPVGNYKYGDMNYRLPLHRNYQQNYNVAHPLLSYYATAPYRICPREAYKRPPGDNDYRAAFTYAVEKLQKQNYATMSYLNQSMPSYAARHQIFSSLATGNSRADEQGLLVEYASEYLASRLCLTKWDKQRYLPTLTLGATNGAYPNGHSCQHYGQQKRSTEGWNLMEATKSRYRTVDGFGNNPYHPYWGKSNVCHIRLLTPDYADGISEPRTSYLPHAPLPNARAVSNYIHKDIHLQGPYNMLKMQWGQFINHDITNTQLSSYEGLVDCCKTPNVRGCYPIYVQSGDKHYQKYNVTCLNFVRSGVCPLCQFGPRQQINKNTAYLDASHVYGSDAETARQMRTFKDGLLRHSVNSRGETLLPLVGSTKDGQCQGNCYVAGDSRVNQHPALTALHVLLMRRHNQHARALAQVHRNYNDEMLYQEARRIVIAEYQMITYNEYLPIVFGPILSEYYHLTPGKGYQQNDYTHYNKDVDPTTWNEYVTAACRFGHSQIQNLFGLYPRILSQYDQKNKAKYMNGTSTFRLKDWFMNPSLLNDGLTQQIVNGLVSRPSAAVDPWVANDVRNYLYKSRHERTGGDLAATNIQRGRDHGLPSYTHYLEYCFNHKVKSWQDLSLYIPNDVLDQLKRLYVVPENIDLFTGGMSERHFPEADIGPTFACINGIQYYHLKFGDRYYFEHRGQAGSFTPEQLYEIKKSTLARLLCRTAYLPSSPPYAFFYPSQHNQLLDCARYGEIDYKAF